MAKKQDSPVAANSPRCVVSLLESQRHKSPPSFKKWTVLAQAPATKANIIKMRKRAAALARSTSERITYSASVTCSYENYYDCTKRSSGRVKCNRFAGAPHNRA